MADDVRRFAGEGACAFVGPGIGDGALAELRQGLGLSARIDRWSEVGSEGSFVPTRAEAIVVGSESEWLLAQAAASGKPVLIYPMRQRQLGWVSTLREAITRRADLRPINTRGTARPQAGLEYLCARLIERGLIRPPPDLTALHRDLFGLGVAIPFGASLDSVRPAPMLEAAQAAQKVKQLLGYAE
jgi:hypothetical protein